MWNIKRYPINKRCLFGFYAYVYFAPAIGANILRQVCLFVCMFVLLESHGWPNFTKFFVQHVELLILVGGTVVIDE